MKKLIIAIGLLGFYFSSYGQEAKSGFLKKGSGVSGTYILGGYSPKLGIVGSTGVRYGYFIQDNLALGFDSRLMTNGDRYREINFGPYVRYYLSGQRIKPFFEARYGFGLSESKVFDGQTNESGYRFESAREHNGYIGTGLLLLNKSNRLGIEFSAGYEFDFSKRSKSRFTVGTGLNIKL